MPNLPKKAVFPVGGLGSRFLPVTKSVPKEMLPVVDKPLIQYAVEEAKNAGVEHFIFVTGRGKNAIEDHFDVVSELQHSLRSRGKVAEIEVADGWLPESGEVSYTRQREPLGLGHAVWCARHLVGNEPFIVILPDDFIVGAPSCLQQMISSYASVGGNVLAIMEVPLEDIQRYGAIVPGAADERLVEVKGLVEKPSPNLAPSRYAVIGRYILLPEVFEYLERHELGASGEIQITDALTHLVGKAPFHGYLFEGERFDCGDRIGYLKANLSVALNRTDVGPELASFVRSLSKRL